MDEQTRDEQQGGIWVPPSVRAQAPKPPEEPVASEAEPELVEPEAQPAADGVDYQDKYLRALAEVENVRRRASEQQKVAVQRANERFLTDLLPLLDGVERGLAAAGSGASLESLQQGLELVGRQLQAFLESQGIEAIAAEVGDEFNPEQHEAMMRLPATDEAPEGHIVQVLERGYRHHGRVLRAARVAVAAAPLDEKAD